MDHLWSPWRYTYVTTADKIPWCLFCEVLKSADDRQVWIVHRGKHCFVMLNAYPYTSGHVMVAPYAHLDQLQNLAPEAATEMMMLTQKMESIQRQLYHPDGLNIGMNMGRAAGAGVVGHIHMHVLPRWVGDGSFMTSVGETRVLPESLETTYERMKAFF